MILDYIPDDVPRYLIDKFLQVSYSRVWIDKVLAEGTDRLDSADSGDNAIPIDMES